MEKLKQNPIVKKLGLNRILLVCVLILMFLVFKVVLGNKFPAVDSIKSTLNYVYFLGFLSLGVTFVIATGGIDFSIGSSRCILRRRVFSVWVTVRFAYHS